MLVWQTSNLETNILVIGTIVGQGAARPTVLLQFDMFLINLILFCYTIFMQYKRMYLNDHSYFLTVVTHRRKPILIDNIESLRCAFKLSKTKYEYKIDAIVILPEHFHMIITPKHSKDYSKIISYIKRTFIYGLEQSLKEEGKLEISDAKYRRRHAGIWQERFYEHTIRDEKDWLKTLEYIQFNPVKHGLVEDIDDWEYSSFYKNRRSGCPLPDKNKHKENV